MKKILLASRNQKKVQELADLLAGLPYEVVSLDNYPDCPEVEEDGETFAENSEKKAREVSQFTGEWTVADDSGLAVDALSGAPGVYSARYGGLEDDPSRNQFLLDNMKGIPADHRHAHFLCCATLYGDGKVLFQSQGKCEGRILFEPRGTNGFGYDPVFQPEGMNCSMAQLTPEEKHRISHRGQALGQVRGFLLNLP